MISRYAFNVLETRDQFSEAITALKKSSEIIPLVTKGHQRLPAVRPVDGFAAVAIVTDYPKIKTFILQPHLFEDESREVSLVFMIFSRGHATIRGSVRLFVLWSICL